MGVAIPAGLHELLGGAGAGSRDPIARHAGILAGLERQLERRRVSGRGGRHREHELGARIAVDAVPRIAQALLSPARAGRLGEDLVAERIVEEELRGEIVHPTTARRRPDLEVDVHGPAPVGAGIDRGEAREAVAVRGLVAAQELLAERGPARVLHVGVDADRVAVPQIHHGTGQRRAGTRREARDAQRQPQRGAGPHATVRRIGADVRPVQLLVHEVRALGQRGAHHARGHASGLGPAAARGQRGEPARPQERESLPPGQDRSERPVVVSHRTLLTSSRRSWVAGTSYSQARPVRTPGARVTDTSAESRPPAPRSRPDRTRTDPDGGPRRPPTVAWARWPPGTGRRIRPPWCARRAIPPPRAPARRVAPWTGWARAPPARHRAAARAVPAGAASGGARGRPAGSGCGSRWPDGSAGRPLRGPPRRSRPVEGRAEPRRRRAST